MSIFAELRGGIVTTSPEAMMAVGERLATELPDQSVLALLGDLGVGKSTFVRGLAKGLGIDKHLTSPTFTIYALYRGDRQLLHMDAYRLQSARDADQLMLDEFLRPPYILAVEWPERIPGWFPPQTYWLRFAILSPGQHEVRLVDRPCDASR